MKISSTEKGTKFFKSYLETTKLENITRSGFGLWGIYSKDQTIIDVAQSDGEHCNGMHKIASDIPIFYPRVFQMEDAWKYHLVISLHEYGEIGMGRDIPDDGSQEHAKKAQVERDYIFKVIEECYPEKYHILIKQFFTEFEKQSTYFGKTAYLIDKFDAILRGFAYELNGKAGNLNKKLTPTSKDLDEANFTKTTSLTDNWLYGLLWRAKDYPNIEAFLEICQSAAVYIRGEPMEWLERI